MAWVRVELQLGLGASKLFIVDSRQRIHGDWQPVAGYGYTTFID